MIDEPSHVRAKLLWLLTLVFALSGCFRDGFECASNADCFDGETCSSGACVGNESNNACRPASDEQLCAAADPCVAELEVTDSCGTPRQIVCDCADACVPETEDTLCQAAGATCGMLSATDSCADERTVACGTCDEPETCVENECTLCPPPTCPANADCGVATNGCGDKIDCGGSCGSDEICVDFACGDPVLRPNSVATGDRFGETIEVDGGYVFIGAPYVDSEDVTDVGAIYVFRRFESSFALSQVIRPAEAVSDARFGQAFDVKAGRLLAGSADRLLEFSRDMQGQFQFASSQPAPSRVVAIGLFDNETFLAGFEDTGDHQTLFHGECTNAGCALAADAWMPPGIGDEVGLLGLGKTIATAGRSAIVGAPFDNVAAPDDDDAEGSAYLLSQASNDGDWRSIEWGPVSTYRYLNFTGFPSDEQPSLRAGSSVAITGDGFAGFGAPDSTVPQLSQNLGEVFLMSPISSAPFSVESRYRGVTNAPFLSCGLSIDFIGPTDSKTALVSCLYARDRADDDQLTLAERQQTSGHVRRYDLQPLGDWRINSPSIRLADPNTFDHFGWSIATDDANAYIGAPGRDTDRGEVYIYSHEEISQ